MIPLLSSRLSLSAAGVVALSTAALSFSPTAQACGGFFCQSIAVDQNAERIYFEVNGDGTISAVVEIRYSGDAPGFSWVIPVNGEPALDVIPQSSLRLLDGATLPRIIPPNQYGWEDGGGVFAASDSAAEGGDDDGGVTVEDLPQVGPFDPQLITATDAGPLVEWLMENGYTVTPAMEPYMDVYIDEGLSFLGMKLAPDAAVGDIAPIRMTFADDLPMIPLILTSVAAEPEMGFEVFISADQRYGAVGYSTLEVNEDLLMADPRTGETNYYAVLSWQADEAGGHAFFTEYASASETVISNLNNVYLGMEDEEEARVWMIEAVNRHPYMTRLYTRMSNWEMNADPEFAPVEGGDVSNVHDLSDRPPIHYSVDVQPPVKCGVNYCGDGALCAITDLGIEGCACPNGFIGRTITAPRLGSLGSMPTVACQMKAFDLFDADETADELGLNDVCEAVDCGEGGSCVARNGIAMCECGDGFAAVNVDGSPTCAAVTDLYGPEQLLWEDFYNTGCAGCDSSTPSRPGVSAALALLVGLILRRRNVRA